MLVRCTVTIAAVLCGTVAWAQSQDAQHVFQLSNSNSQQAREIAYAVQSLLAPYTVADGRGKSISIDTSPADLAMAEWVIDALDRPVQTQDIRVDFYPGSTGSARLAIFRLARTEPPQVLSELVNASRTVPEITEMYPVSQANAIVARADQDKLDKAEWILRQLELPAAQDRPVAKSQLASPHVTQELRVLYTREALPAPAFQEIVSVIRAIPPVMKVFPVTSKGAVAVAGPADEIALGEWLFQQLDRPAPDPSLGSPSHDAPSGDTVQVFFMRASLTEENLRDAVNRLRGVTRPYRVLSCSASRAIVVRGTPAELSQAAEIVRDAARQ
jgi:hypothetical protein